MTNKHNTFNDIPLILDVQYPGVRAYQFREEMAIFFQNPGFSSAPYSMAAPLSKRKILRKLSPKNDKLQKNEIKPNIKL